MSRSQRVAVCSWSLRPEDPADLTARLRRTGLDAVQLALSPLVDEPERWQSAIDLIREAGIAIVSGMMAFAGEDYSTLDSIARTGGLRPDATWPANRSHSERVADVAEAHAIELVTFHAGFLPEDADDPERAVILERLRAIADIFAARSLRIGFESGQETASALADALRDLDRPNVGINFDPANMILYGKGDPVAALAQLAPNVVQVHVKDALPSAEPGGWGRETPVGEGAVDWPAFMAIARAIVPPIDFVIEREAGGEREEDVVAARNLIERELGQGS